MAVKLRLQRYGKRDASTFRIVAIEKSNKRDGKIISKLGYYNPNVKPPILKMDNQKVKDWLSHGAIPSNTVRKLIENNK